MGSSRELLGSRVARGCLINLVQRLCHVGSDLPVDIVRQFDSHVLQIALGRFNLLHRLAYDLFPVPSLFGGRLSRRACLLVPRPLELLKHLGPLII